MHKSLIPYLATFWIMGSRAGGLKIGPLLFRVLQITPNSSAIYKLTCRLVGWLAQHCTSIVLCPPNNTRSSTIYKLIDELQGWWAQDCNCLRMVIHINYLTLPKNIIFNTKVLILNIDIVQFN